MLSLRLAPLLLLLACKDKDSEEAGSSATDSYTDALCRLYTDPACTTAMQEECTVSISFDTEADCRTFLGYLIDGCTGAAAWFSQNADLVQSCAEQVNGIECGTDPLCDEAGADAATTGPCAEIDAQLDALCGADTGR